MKFIIGRKIDMTQIWKGEKVVAATRVEAGPCTIVQVKNEKTDGYSAVQVSYGTRKEKNIKKPQLVRLKGLVNARYLREFRFEKEVELKKGDMIDVGTFQSGDAIQVTGISKGRGFQGVVKRHGFSGSKKTHGNKDQLRMPGSVGATGPAHVFKGTRMGGRMGNDKVTIKNLEVLDIDKENNILYIKGGLPGARNGLILIAGDGELKVSKNLLEKQAEPAKEPVKEEKKTEIKEEVKVEEKKEEVKAEEPKKEEIKTEEPKKEEVKKEAVKEPETPEEVEKEVIEAKEKVDAKSEEKK